ncbi:MAG: PD40 domain-containing protein, partial [Thermoguttaceae bacterium]|nr:PD40 domain-containing protein [Thermoguttaceae bacterium]
MHFPLRTSLFAALFTLVAATFAVAQDGAEPTKLLRYPDIFENQVVFCYAGDIWKSDLDGQNVVRLTAHPGLENFPKFSPDGRWIAFTGQYDGDDQVYVIPSQGGVPKQLTYYPTPFASAPRRGFDAQVLGWTPDSQRVMFRSKRGSDGVDSLTNIYLVAVDGSVSAEGGLPESIGTPVAGAGDLSNDGRKLLYSPLFRDFRHWKRYEGGWAQYLLIFDRETGEFTEVPTTPRTDRDPMWLGDVAYFVSDRDGTMNIYKYVPEDEENPVQKITDSTEWDVRFASSDGRSQIVYEFGGALRVYNAENGETRELSICVPGDGLAARPSRVKVADKIESFDLSPKGERALFVARGEVFTVPQSDGNGAPRNLTKTSGAHDRCAVWSPDGKWIAFFSDETGEDQVYVIDQLGEHAKIQLTESLRCKLDDLTWAPDGSALSFRDAYNHLWALKLKINEETQKPENDGLVEVARDYFAHFPRATWSPDGAYLAYELGQSHDFTSIFIWEKATGESRRVTDPSFQNDSPAWSADGDWLFFIGRREFYPQFSSVEWNFAGDRFDGIFAMALRKDVKNIFAPKSDEAATDAEEDVKDAEETAEAKKIDFDGIENRVVRLPIGSENYERLSAAKDVLYFVKTGASYYGRESDVKPTLLAFDLKTQKLGTFLDDCGSYALSTGGKLLARKDGWKLYDATASAGEAKSFSTDGLVVDLVPAEEWAEIYDEVWRRFRDYFYVKNMHGVDWEALG